MPIVARGLFGVIAALGFGWRRTGSTGFRGVSGRLGSAEWFAGAGFVAAPAVAVLASILQLLDVVAPVAVLHAPWIQIGGIVAAIVGIFATVYAQLDMGDSWRIGVDPGETTTLVRTGVFGWVRNPIFTAMITFGFGIALVTPNLVALAGFDEAGGAGGYKPVDHSDAIEAMGGRLSSALRAGWLPKVTGWMLALIASPCAL